MAATDAKYLQLDAQKIIETVELLHRRIEERFPGSGLGRIAAELLGVAQATVTRTRWIQRPHLPLRCAAVVLSLAIIAILIGMLGHIRQFQFTEYSSSIQALDASISAMVFIGAAILFLISCEIPVVPESAGSLSGLGGFPGDSGKTGNGPGWMRR